MYRENFLSVFPFVFFRRFNQVAVVAALLQFHHNIQETRCAASGPFGKSLVIPGQDPPVNYT